MRDDEPRPVWMSLLITKLAVHAGGSGHNGGEKGNVLIASVLLSITIYFALRSETQGGVKVLRM